MLFISQLFFSSAGMKSTCIGREVNALRKHGGEVREMAKTLVKEWKLLVPDANPSMTHSPQSETPSSHSTQGHTQQRQQQHQSRQQLDSIFLYINGDLEHTMLFVVPP